MLVLLDTSFLLAMLRDHLEFDEEIRSSVQGPVQLLTVELVRLELEKLARGSSSRTGVLANLALDQLERKKISVLENRFGATDTDTALLISALSNREPAMVATVDRSLRERLNKTGVPTIHPRRRRGLTLSQAHSPVLK